MRKLLLRAGAAALLGVVPAIAGATTVSLSYKGADPDDRYVTSTGTGSLSFAKEGSLALADLATFAFDLTITSTDPSLRYSDTFSYTLGDLASFSATAAGGTLTALALRTGYESPPDHFLAPEYVVVTSLRANGLVTYFGPGDDAQHGTLAASPVPEPATWALLLAGFGTVGVATRRARRGRRPA